uniref:RNA-dependent RNA polymerase n=1 Tax=Beauveria bassiana splipalmivirus 1 TaxID=3096631 RepID=A0AAF1BWS9_9VIRU|nr:MAG: RNA-dependent RNA polymerase [Beauveria bassiana splipalmivirus 1]
MADKHILKELSPCLSPRTSSFEDGSEYFSALPSRDMSFKSALTRLPWNENTDVLSTKSFPSTSILRYKTGTCNCGPTEAHRPLFDLCQTVIGPHCANPTNPLIGIKVCWNAENIWECKLPRSLTGMTKRVPFEKLGTIYRANMVLFKGTYWFSRLMEKDAGGAKHGRNGIAVLRLLAGLKSFSGPERIDQLVKMRLIPSAVQKLRQILATVDGLLMQLVLCFPNKEEILNWAYMDRVCNSLISCLLPDYFRDMKGDYTRLTTYEKVKSIRKSMKEYGFNPVGTHERVEVPQELSFFRGILKALGNEKSPISTYRLMTACQTRASGVPPRAVYYKTMDKIVKILKEPSSYEAVKAFGPYIRPALEKVYFQALSTLGGNENRDRFFSRCVSAAKISLSDSGEFFTKSENGGKLEAARLVLKDLEYVDHIDLVTGQKTGRVVRTESNQGTMLFMWACNQFYDRKTVYDRNVMSVRISLVAELGKYRAITVSHLAHAVLLHVMSHVLLEFLRVIPSSESGIGAANHAWNFFKRLSHKNPSANFIFGDKDVYCFSTDWKQATDFCDHHIAQVILNNLCVLFGIPKWYRETCVFALCAPRQVETLDPESKTLEMFLTGRGELMGDPVVKVILHAYHLVCREAACRVIQKWK